MFLGKKIFNQGLVSHHFSRKDWPFINFQPRTDHLHIFNQGLVSYKFATKNWNFQPGTENFQPGIDHWQIFNPIQSQEHGPADQKPHWSAWIRNDGARLKRLITLDKASHDFAGHIHTWSGSGILITGVVSPVEFATAHVASQWGVVLQQSLWWEATASFIGASAKLLKCMCLHGLPGILALVF